MWLMEIRLERRKKNTKMALRTHKKQGLSQSLTLLCDETARSHSSRTHYYMCFRQREAFRWRGNTRRCVVTEDSCVIFIHWSHVLATYQSHEQVLSVLILTLTHSLSPLSFFDCILYFCLFCWSVSRTACEIVWEEQSEPCLVSWRGHLIPMTWLARYRQRIDRPPSTLLIPVKIVLY